MLNESGEKFLKKIFRSDYKTVKLAGDASSRIYYRITTDVKSFILCFDPNFETENAADYPFLKIQKLFSISAVPVPDIYAFDYSGSYILQSDHGDDLLLDIIDKSSGSERIVLYKAAIDELIKIQSIKGDDKEIPFSISFDVEKLMFEFIFFIENTLKIHFGFDSDDEIKKLREYFENICHLLYQPSIFVLCHRDYHSRNILYKDKKTVLIDFQDARMGLPQYDLASLLRDSYATLSDSEHDKLLNYYYELSIDKKIHGMKPDEFNYYYDLVSFQRNIKAAGSFGYLTHVKNLSYYEKFIESTLLSASIFSLKKPELAPAMKIILKAAGLQ
jgi:hypothetical protein